MLRLGGRGPLFRMHLDSRHVEELNLLGRNQCFARIAELLEAMPGVRGLVGTSWFYDPQLERISPHLHYLRKVPMDGGAFLRIDGPGEIHTQRATARSETRRRLYEEGKYSPVCATVGMAEKRSTGLVENDAVERESPMLGRIHNALERRRYRWFNRRQRTIRFDSGIVSFTFDDFPATAAKEGAELLEKQGWRGTFYLAPGLLDKDTAVGRVSSLRDLERLHGRGHQMVTTLTRTCAAKTFVSPIYIERSKQACKHWNALMEEGILPCLLVLMMRRRSITLAVVLTRFARFRRGSIVAT